ncbi:PLP-dependent aminotransferase family protein, partial [Klebsiella pneumoniae]
LALAEFIEAGHFTRHLRRMRRLYGERRDALQAAIERHLDGIVTVSGGAGGMHLSARLDAPVPDTEVSRAARAHGMVLR